MGRFITSPRPSTTTQPAGAGEPGSPLIVADTAANAKTPPTLKTTTAIYRMDRRQARIKSSLES